MNELLKELTKWIEEKQNEELQSASECNDFEEMSRADAYIWCADSYRCVKDKIEELKKKYHV